MTDWSALKVVDLKQELKARNIPLTGLKLKQHYIDKLEEYEANAGGGGDDSKAQVSGDDVADQIGESDQRDEAQDEQIPANEPQEPVAATEQEEANSIETDSKVADKVNGQDSLMTDKPAEPSAISVDTAIQDVPDTSQSEQVPEAQTTQSDPKEDRNAVNGNEDVINGEHDTEMGESHGVVSEARANNAQKEEQTPNISRAGLEQDRSLTNSETKLHGTSTAMESSIEPQPADPVSSTRQDASVVENKTDQEAGTIAAPENVHDDLFVTNSTAVDQAETLPMEESDQGQTAAVSHLDQDSISTTSIPAPVEQEDQRKRKRRSATPDPVAGEIAEKRMRANDGQSISLHKEPSALEQMEAATAEAQAIRAPDGLGHDVEMQSTAELKQQSQDYEGLREEETQPKSRPDTMPAHSQADFEDEKVSDADDQKHPTVSPALHPATSSLYLRNFKRPLHIPTLRSHVSTLAKPRAGDDDSDPIKLFYLDNVRTHAFISFHSSAQAARVRSAMHDVRYPDEALREPLFVDFVPDDKVQGWIDRETAGGGSAGGRSGFGRGAGRRYEVLYHEADDGIEAKLVDVDGDTGQRRPSLTQKQSNHTPNPAVTASVPQGVHLDRATMVPQERSQRRTSALPQRQQQHSPLERAGKGFKALDELFSSTATKPKLYYKEVSRSVADERFEMFKDLRVGHAEMGRSGDEGMKRYSFETYKGREEWVNKGPEFGFGRKGQDRLTGFRGGRGGGFARGGAGSGWRGRRG